MYSDVILTPDKITLSIEHKDVSIEKVISVNAFITEIILPIIQIYEERADIEFTSFSGKYIWVCRRFSIVYDSKTKRILIQFRGAYFLITNAISIINLLLKKLNEMQTEFHITEADYQISFKSDSQRKLYNAFLKSETGYSCKDNIEKGLLINGYGKNVNQLDSYSISNTVFAVKLYNKTKQLKILDDKIKNETIKKYGESDNLFRLEIAYTRKSATIKKLNAELLKDSTIKNKSLDELINKTDKFKFNKNFIRKIQESL